MIILNKHFETRPDPRKGSVLRIQVSDGYFYYLCVTSGTRAWLYRFRTIEPACGSDFFDRSYWGWGMQFFDYCSDFLDCGNVKLEGLPYTYTPTFYSLIPSEEAALKGYRYNMVICKSWNTLEKREISPEEIHEMGYALDRFADVIYEEIISQYIPQMELREVPAKHIDKRDPETLKKTVKKPTILTVRVTLREEDLTTDEPELDIEEPLAEALEDAQCGSFASSGTEPGGLFSIDFTTSSATKAKCLKVIERILKKTRLP